MEHEWKDLTRKKRTVRRYEISNVEIWAECFERNPVEIRTTDSYAIVALMIQLCPLLIPCFPVFFLCKKPKAAGGVIGMTVQEYNYIIQVINANAYERGIFLKIRAELEAQGYELSQIAFEDYLTLRSKKMQPVNDTTVIRENDTDRKDIYTDLPHIAENVRDAEKKQTKKRNWIFEEGRLHIIGTLLFTGILVAAGIVIPSISLPIWGIALCVLAWGLKDDIPLPKNYDTDYVDRYFKAQEDARLYTNAMLHQAYLHKDQLRTLNNMINGRK
jgi:hypothetical protein